METEDFVKVLKDLCKSWEQNNSETSDTAIEINMWRRYFLRREMKPYSDAKKNEIEATFMALPIAYMIKRDPKITLKQLEDEYDNR